MHLSYGLRRKVRDKYTFRDIRRKFLCRIRTFTSESQQTASECPFNDLLYFILLVYYIDLEP